LVARLTCRSSSTQTTLGWCTSSLTSASTSSSLMFCEGEGAEGTPRPGAAAFVQDSHWHLRRVGQSTESTSTQDGCDGAGCRRMTVSTRPRGCTKMRYMPRCKACPALHRLMQRSCDKAAQPPPCLCPPTKSPTSEQPHLLLVCQGLEAAEDVVDRVLAKLKAQLAQAGFERVPARRGRRGNTSV
jgi:hypothetical protein